MGMFSEINLENSVFFSATNSEFLNMLLIIFGLNRYTFSVQSQLMRVCISNAARDTTIKYVQNYILLFQFRKSDVSIRIAYI